jgi:DNA-binding CsgD family transcriptional regulator
MTAVATGWQHFAEADWAAAREAFAAVLESQPGDPEALDGLGQSLWWLGERNAAIDHRREAYAIYQRRGDARCAGGLAVYLAAEHRIDGRDAEAAGWMARARRLLADETAGMELGWLAIEDAKRAADPAVAERHARAALDLAHTMGSADVECMALAQLGRALVHQGRSDEGLALLDEAMTVALGGESSDPLACSDACCTTLVVCDGLADLRRATQWCEAVVEFAERRHFTPMQAWCRSIYAGVLIRAGDWEQADRVLAEALRREQDRRRGGGSALPLAMLAGLRLRQGRVDEAQRLLTGLEDEPVARIPIVQLQLATGDRALAVALLERGPDDTEHLSLRGQVALDEGRLDAARGAAERLRALDDPHADAEAAFLTGRIAAAAALGDPEGDPPGLAPPPPADLTAALGDPEGDPPGLAPPPPADLTAALGALEDAVARFCALRFPLEEGRARLALARVQAAAGSPFAPGSARAACRQFERLGAQPDADRAAALLRSLGVAGRTAVRGERDELTLREREVLGLIVEGRSNAQIADRLVIAPKTAEHHVSRVLAKLGVRSRAEAAAQAVRDGLT